MITAVTKKLLWTSLILVLLIAALGIGLGIGLNRGAATNSVRHSGSVVSNGHECAAIGGKILQQMNGNAADAAVATLFCEGVAVPQSCGLGGGLFLTVYTKATGKVETLNAREVAPKAATEDMFVGVDTVTGIKSVAVPGELKGIWELHQRYGSLQWRTLIEPSIDLCRQGHIVSRYFGDVLKLREDTITSQPSLAEVFINPETNSVWVEGDIIKRPKLAETLELIADEGADTLYNNGTLSQMLVNEIQELGGIITIEDFMDYSVRWEDSISTTFMNNTIHTVPLPASGSVLILILNVLNGFLPSVKNLTFYQRFVECFKFAFAKRTELADYFFVPEVYETFQQMLDPDYAQDIRSKIEDDRTYQNYEHYGANFSVPDDHGTAHISVVAPNGDAIAVTTTINTILGSKVRSRTTGIILNDQMDDFSTPGVTNAFGVPASPANFIVPGKRPLSSMCPTIVIDEHGDAKLVIGSAGGTRITTSVAYIIISMLMFNEPLAVTLPESRFHHQLAPMYIDYEIGFNDTILQGLIGIGHEVYTEATTYGFVAVTAIARENNQLTAMYDNRRHGSTFVF
ncbi:glutathione hydrolase 1 proenzyme-like isoform X2 [Bradysia coprophila]|uniref:glutathione hydrolase 1 proenzyme-like isoform X1 n=2 Tax=Bradysia coprophila TaxID=38358 RepID=UPI00187DBDD7|nr:glutathione hydrolase 1 proenzyme-like isoform X1 [Bradysia coprophila]XP_037030021.1 glutathione hydrolase 1 proenzyme-like isoform X2 [Bradysia coprophila]